MDKLVKEKILENLPEKRLNISIFDEIDSTNDEAKRIELNKEFQVLVANKQTNGRGRQGKKWLSPDSGNIYMTICTENDLSYAPASLITGLICINSLSQLNESLKINLKWPNDILMKNKKIGGILVEKEWIDERVKTIIGIGINLDIQNIENKEHWWGDLSMYDFNKKRNKLINLIIQNFIKFYDEKTSWINEWRDKCMHIDKEIEIYKDHSLQKKAIFKDINLQGDAIIDTNRGTEILRSGQINIKGIY